MDFVLSLQASVADKPKDPIYPPISAMSICCQLGGCPIGK